VPLRDERRDGFEGLRFDRDQHPVGVVHAVVVERRGAEAGGEVRGARPEASDLADVLALGPVSAIGLAMRSTGS